MYFSIQRLVRQTARMEDSAYRITCANAQRCIVAKSANTMWKFVHQANWTSTASSIVRVTVIACDAPYRVHRISNLMLRQRIYMFASTRKAFMSHHRFRNAYIVSFLIHYLIYFQKKKHAHSLILYPFSRRHQSHSRRCNSAYIL